MGCLLKQGGGPYPRLRIGAVLTPAALRATSCRLMSGAP